MELSRLKDTALGPMPADWLSGSFQDFMTGFSSGQTPSRSRPDYFKGDILWITSGELNYNVITDTLEKVTSEAVQDTGLKVIPKDTFLIAITGLEAEGTRGSCGITGKPSTTNQSCMALYPGERLLLDYLYHFYVLFGDRLALKYCQGTKQQSYTGGIVRELPMVIPPTLAEQKAISDALNDTDQLITSLENLILKKKAVRTGMMEVLFSAGKRIKGFDKPWTTRRLGSICSQITTGKLDANAMVTNGLYRFYTCAREFYYIDQYAFDTEALLVSGNGSHVGYIHYFKGKFNAYQRTYVLTGFDENIHFIKAYMEMFLKERISTEVNAGNTPYIKMDTLTEMDIHLPSDKEEQAAIAKVMKDLDDEIEQLCTKQDKYRNVRKAMLQQLLTGSTRLV